MMAPGSLQMHPQGLSIMELWQYIIQLHLLGSYKLLNECLSFCRLHFHAER